MCDEFSPFERATTTRRGFAALSGAAALAARRAMARSGGGAALSETTVSIPTPAGRADAVFIHPLHGAHPGVVMWPDIGGLRDAFRIMARRLAAAGYAVLVVNQYYRNARAPVLTSFADWMTPSGQARLRPMIAALNPPEIASDGDAFVRWLDSQAAVDKRRGIASSGYCMGGPFALRTAAAAPARVTAVASFHGANLVTTRPDSPHLLIAQTKARFLFAIGRNDDARAPGDKDALRAAAAAAQRPAEITVYPADHGWCVIDTPAYDPAEADRAWDRMLALFAQL
ncbi:MAG: dienelactone hydrolase family protein [Sphingomonadales bacterium]|nr:dienelactone hydrolase family protein [Sphingomonadales bacterium]